MKRHLNTLFVTSQGAYLAKKDRTVLVRVDGETRLRLPLHTLGGIVCFGNVSASPFLLGACADAGLAVSFLTENGRFLARVAGPASGNVLLRREQFRRADDPEACSRMARWFLLGKLANAKTVLYRSARDRPELGGSADLKRTAKRLDKSLQKLRGPMSTEEARGLEGDAAHAYFSVFAHMITASDDAFEFSGRNRRPPMDPVNALLSFVYVLLAHDVRSALECHGLDPSVGFLHRDRPGRHGLALDLMEEFRPFLADRLVLSLINQGQIKGKGFSKTPAGGVAMDDDSRKALLLAWQKRKQDEIRHPFLGETVHVGMLFHIQALLLARYLRGDLDAYPPFVWR